jgi:DNA polymerase beta
VKDRLNHHQLIGLKYFSEFKQRIPREEVAEIESIVKSVLPDIDPKLILTTCGSFRRQKPTCGDIDMLLSHPDYTSHHKTPPFVKQLVAKLKSKKLLTDDISLGDHSYHGVCTVNRPGAIHRRIDILWIPYDQYYFGLLYFTGSGFFNIQMRRIALEKGFTLNEKEILPIGEDVSVGRVRR